MNVRCISTGGRGGRNRRHARGSLKVPFVASSYVAISRQHQTQQRQTDQHYHENETFASGTRRELPTLSATIPGIRSHFSKEPPSKTNI
jgi:hypothetical protein